MNTYYQSQGLVKNNQLAFSAKLYDAYFVNKRQQFPFRAVKDSKVASVAWVKTDLVPMVADRHSQIRFEVSNMEPASLIMPLLEWHSTAKK